MTTDIITGTPLAYATIGYDTEVGNLIAWIFQAY